MTNSTFNVRLFSRWAAVTLMALTVGFTTSCKDEEEDERVPPDLSFKTGANYTFANKIVGMGDSVLVGCVVTKKEDDLKSFNISVSYDGGALSTRFNHFTTGAEVGGYAHDYWIVTRSQAGTEKWVFTVVDKDGNQTQKNIVLTVQ